jgi:hypothetical protein
MTSQKAGRGHALSLPYVNQLMTVLSINGKIMYREI